MAGRRRGDADGRAESTPVLPGEVGIQELYGAPGPDQDDPEDEAVVVPPVRLPEQSELVRAALAAPLLELAVRLARWTGPSRPVDEYGDLTEEQEALAVGELAPAVPQGADPEGPEGPLATLLRAWTLAVGLELIVLDKAQPEEGAAAEVARPGPALALLDGGDPEQILELWLTAFDVVADLTAEVEPELEPEGESVTDEQLEELEHAEEDAADLLGDALEVLYESYAFAEEEGTLLPLGVLAALLVVPEGEEPTEEMLGEITSVMVALDPMLADLAEIGVVEYHPIDPALFEEQDAEQAPAPDLEAPVGEEEAARFGRVRLTPLGVYGVREQLLAQGYDAPLVGEHARGDAAALLGGISESANVLPEQEIQEWLKGREPAAAAAELLAAARGDDPLGPVRRMFCQVALTALGTDAEPVVHGVLDDPQLGGFARAWLVDRGVPDVPEPSREVLLWTTVDTLAAQLLDSAVEVQLLQELIGQLPAQRDPVAFFAEMWRVDHPYTAEVLEAIGELHPDRSTAKEARRAAFKARSQRGKRS
jgi:hypothetical protein